MTDLFICLTETTMDIDTFLNGQKQKKKWNSLYIQRVFPSKHVKISLRLVQTGEGVDLVLVQWYVYVFWG